MEKSTRISIVEHSLADVVERLSELPSSPHIDELRRRAQAYEVTVSEWMVTRPTESERAHILAKVLDLNVEVIRAGGVSGKSVHGADDLDSEASIPTARRVEPTEK